MDERWLAANVKDKGLIVFTAPPPPIRPIEALGSPPGW
jgi:hypothetical protein